MTSFTAKAEAEAEAILVKAKAEAEAIRLKVCHIVCFCTLNSSAPTSLISNSLYYRLLLKLSVRRYFLALPLVNRKLC